MSPSSSSSSSSSNSISSSSSSSNSTSMAQETASSSSSGSTQLATSVTISTGYSGSSITTTIIAPSGTAPSTVIVQTPLPTLNCDSSGYLVQDSALYKVNITTGSFETIKAVMGDGSAVNAMGYNAADNFLYAATIDESPYNLIRISGSGDTTNLGSLNTTFPPNCGDVDENSQYWASSNGKDWVQVDLKPGSPTNGQTIASGIGAPAQTIIDWAYVPGAGDYLWTVGFDSSTRSSGKSSNTYLLRFDRADKSWTTVTKFGDIAGKGDSARNAWGAVYASDDRYLYGSENNSGEIWRFPIPANGVGTSSDSPIKISNGPAASWNDGARCINAANI
ncbi:hypothetical protein diail_5233 [Diaporthe ilicicola]|nr:hypothetical protein diail_5233 [Diaporthe ilicicola]